MTPPLDQVVTRAHRRHGEPALTLDFARAGVRVTTDGEVEALGFVHYYLATWAARVSDGEAPKPSTWPELVYDYQRGRLTFPVAPGEAERVARAFVALLRRPGMVHVIRRRR